MRPLLICDCDEVLLHMVRHFGDWIGEAHDMDFTVGSPEIWGSMKHRATGETPAREEMWALLHGFFPAEMGRQTPVPHAAESLAALGEQADIVVLTNIADQCRGPRRDQLAKFGIDARVECNSGGKGEPVARLVAEYGATVAVFVDDLSVHHESVARHAPQVHRLHMVSEPELAPHIAPAPHAHARIDDWRDARAWIAARFDAGTPAAT
ncbi:MAG TPA: HAD family hydrolase [Sphingomonas sp.]|jgi:hypothetical protein|uniref:HAD family hydrolase n=1 Tax=Sphingomonas sp. TaxID=28214 RepID=UPI002EDB7B2A